MVDPSRGAALLEAIEALYFGYRAFTAHPDRLLQRRGLGRVHHRILYFVARQPNVVVNDLLRTLAVSKQALNGPLRQLLEMGLVSAQPAPADRRYKQLRLTPAGESLEEQITATQSRLLERAFAAAGPQAEAGWRAVMTALAEPERGSLPKSADGPA